MSIFSLIFNCFYTVIYSSSDVYKIKQCKHGIFLLNNYDSVISKYLDVYEEYSESEVKLFFSLIKPGDIVIDVGANIGIEYNIYNI